MSARSARANILLVDDAPDTLDIVGRHLRAAGFGVTTALGARPALAHLERDRFDLVITDLKMPDLSGMELLRRVREGFVDTEVVMITGYASVQGAVEAVKAGAAEYLAKPFTRDELLAAVERALVKLERSRKEREAAAPPAPYRFGLVGRSAVMQAACDALERAAQGRRAILILGERGSGRTTAALGVAAQLKTDAPVLLAGCGRLAPPGSLTRQAEAARGGVLLVRGLEEATAEQEQELMALARSRQPGAARLLITGTATQEPGREGHALAKELFAARSVVTLPPLRDRKGDIPLLVAHFAAAAQANSRGGRTSPITFTADALAAFDAYSWPGNVAELRDMILDLAARPRSAPVDLRELPEPVLSFYSASARSLREVEEEHIRRVLARAGDNKSRAAEILGINRKTLGEKLKSLPPGGKG